MTGQAIVNNVESPHSRFRAVDLGAVKWKDGFWGRQFDRCCNVTIPHLWRRLADPETGHALANLRIYAGLEPGEFQGTAWQDEWVYKWIEAAAYVYGYAGDKTLDRTMDEVIEVIAKAQEPDGYLASQIMRFKERFLKPGNHELYVMGHLLTAACIHHRMTGKSNFLAVARKVGDFMYNTFMPRDPKYAHFGINPSYIMGAVELYRTTGDKRYLELANTFIDMRGSQPGGTDLNQTRVPLRKEEHVVGHAVFWSYLYAGAADAYIETGDKTLMDALQRLWKDLATRKFYMNGGVCAVHYGVSIRKDPVHEAAGFDHDLPNSAAYNETCSQIGNFMWNWRMLLITGEARFADMMEHCIYNSIISGIGLDGASWFYTNPLRWYGKSHPLLSQDAYERFQPGEPPQRHHICCPSNLVRTVAGLHGYFYSINKEGVSIDHYGASALDVEIKEGLRVKLEQETDYPWDGRVAVTLKEATPVEVAIRLRIPGWTRGAAIGINGKKTAGNLAPSSYVTVKRKWIAGDRIELDLPMPVRMMEAHPRVEQCRNQVAITRGPIVYCLESPDLPAAARVSEIRIPRDIKLKPRHAVALLDGVTVLEGKALREPEGDWTGALYRERIQKRFKPQPIRLIPYYAWANRGVSEMTIWMPVA